VKKVRLKNVKLVIQGCVEHLNYVEEINEARAVFRIDSWRDLPLEIGGKRVQSYDEIPEVLENTEVKIREPEAKIVIYYPGEGKIYVGFTDGEYAYMQYITLKEIALLLSEKTKEGET